MKKYMADPVKFAFYGVATLLLLITGLTGIAYRAWIFSIVFLGTGTIFLFFAQEYGTMLAITEKGICKYAFPGAKGRLIPFSQIEEVGVVGSNPLNPTPNKGEKTGVLYIYFSEKKLSQTQRNELVYAIPRSMSFLRYTEQRFEAVQLCWDSKIVHCNTGSRLS